MSALGESLHKHRSQGMDREPVWFLCDSWFLAANQSSNKGREWCSCSGREVSPLTPCDTERGCCGLAQPWEKHSSSAFSGQQRCERLGALWAQEELSPTKVSLPFEGYLSLHGLTDPLSHPERSRASGPSTDSILLKSAFTVRLNSDADSALGWSVVPFTPALLQSSSGSRGKRR